MEKNYIDVFTDGSLVRMGMLIHCGYGIYFPNGEYKNISRRYDHEPITNNRAELYAILKSIILCNKVCEEKKNNKEKNIEKINIYSDSEYSVKTFNKWLKEWKKNGKDYLNKDIIDEIDEHMRNAPFEINLIHVNSHSGKKDYFSMSNDKADRLAKKGAFRIDKKVIKNNKKDKKNKSEYIDEDDEENDYIKNNLEEINDFIDIYEKKK